MKKIFVVYRENDLYKKLVPKIIEWLKDHKVEVIAFPTSANNDEIKIGISTHLATFRNNIIISDETCRNIFYGQVEKENSPLFTNTLDFLCDKAIKTTCGAMFEKGRTNIANEDTDGAEIISGLTEKIRNRGISPKKIYVVTEYTGDHLPFCYWKNGVDDNKDSKRKYEKDIVAPIIAQWFAKKFENKVEIISALRNEEINIDTLKTIDASETWVIMDRHFAAKMEYSGLNCKRFFNQATALRLPISDFFKDVYEHKMLILADELFASEECLKKLIEEEINKG